MYRQCVFISLQSHTTGIISTSIHRGSESIPNNNSPSILQVFERSLRRIVPFIYHNIAGIVYSLAPQRNVFSNDVPHMLDWIEVGRWLGIRCHTALTCQWCYVSVLIARWMTLIPSPNHVWMLYTTYTQPVTVLWNVGDSVQSCGNSIPIDVNHQQVARSCPYQSTPCPQLPTVAWLYSC